MKFLGSVAAPVAAFVIALFAVVGVFTFFDLDKPPTLEPPRDGQMKAFAVNDPPRDAPDMTFRRDDGKTFRLADFRGRVVLVNFWATWCAPCIRELPSLERLGQTLDRDGFALVPVNVDRGGAKVAAPFLEKHNLQDLPLYVDSTMALARALGVKSLPASYLLDQRGKVVGSLNGYADWNSAEAEALVGFYLALSEQAP